MHSIAKRLRDFTRIDPPIFKGSKKFQTSPRSLCTSSTKFFVAMGAKETEKAELDSYQLKDVAQTW